MNNALSRTETQDSKNELLDLLFAEEGITSGDEKLISRRPNPEAYPLSFAQKRLWFLDKLEPGPHYNDHFHLRIQGRLEVAAWQKSLHEIVRRHEVLRASFVVVEGEPTQRIAESLNIELPVIDLISVPEAERLHEAARIALEDFRAPFDFQNGPILRAKLLRMGENDHLLLLTLHHIVIDGWSRSVLLQELTTVYEAFREGKKSPLAPLPIQYADFAHWQQNFVQEEPVQKQIAYWKRQLAGAPPLLEWPTTYPRPAVQSFRGARQSILIPRTTADAIKALSQKEGCTLFMTLLAAFQTVAARYTGQEDIVVGSPIANRNRAEIEGLIGCFLNTLVLRTNLEGNPTFREVMSRVRETSLAAYANQDLPYEKLVEELHPARDHSYNPVFQVMFVLQNTPERVLKTKELNIAPFEIDGGISKFDLTLNLEETPQGISGWIEYATDLFDAAAIGRFAGHYQTLLEAAALNPGQPVATLPLLTGNERRQILETWNNTRADYPGDMGVHRLVESQALKQPDSAAVICGEAQLSYAQLNALANRLARELKNLGVGRGQLVAVCMDRSVEMVTGLLGILKSGAAYLPLDPLLPKERLQFILEDADVPVVLTQSKLLPDLQDLFTTGKMSPALVCLDSNSETPDALDEANIEVKVTGDDPAYVIYTSGSTGKPKGVQITHRALVNFLESMSREPGLNGQDTLLAVTTLSFDIAGLELWLPLTRGAKVIIAPHETVLDGRALARLLESSGATIMQATPTTWRLLLETGWQGNPNLKILCGGEAWSSELANPLHGKCASLWNMYGPTETTIWSAACKIERDEEVVIGSPIANTQFYVLDRNLQPVPVGVAGELWIGGDGLARGYLNRPELTTEKFRPNPFVMEPGARMYRTGDLARFRSDGKIEFLGRLDYQVKLRGFRIELGEIESLLAEHPAVAQAVVIAREDSPGDKRLVAYLLPKPGSTLVTGELRDHLKAKLPEYMVPSVFVVLDKLPLTPNGKVDRKALPAPGRESNESGQNYLAPGNRTEELIAEIWTKVLGVEKAGVNDNFFNLGGHSLLMVQVHNRLCKALGMEISIVKLFQYPTISSLARNLGQPSSGPKIFKSIQDRARLQRQSFARPQQPARNNL
jgi:amino acid adenylation domain-containing protein